MYYIYIWYILMYRRIDMYIQREGQRERERESRKKSKSKQERPMSMVRYVFGASTAPRTFRLSGVLQLADKGIYPLIRPGTWLGHDGSWDTWPSHPITAPRGGTRMFGEDDEETAWKTWSNLMKKTWTGQCCNAQQLQTGSLKPLSPHRGKFALEWTFLCNFFPGRLCLCWSCSISRCLVVCCCTQGVVDRWIGTVMISKWDKQRSQEGHTFLKIF